MRIGMIAPPWLTVPPEGYGGTEAVIDRLARGVQAAGHEVLLWTTGDSTCPVPMGHVLPRAATDQMGIASVELQHLICGYRAMREWGADLIHDHTLVGPLYAERFGGLPVVTTNHGPFDAVLSDLYREVAKAVSIIAISHDQAANAGGIPIAKVIHHGLDLDWFPFGDGEGDAAGPYFLFLGRMTAGKGSREAVHAARAAGVRLLIAAKMQEPLEREFFAQHVEPLLGDGVEYVGEVGPVERLRLLSGARALVNPISWPEPFGLVMIEALACGTPVITLRAGAAPEIVEDWITGRVCDDMDEVAAAMRVAGAFDRRACRKAAETRFSTERMVQDHLDLFESLVARTALTA
jgi:glycosyltransferase involved in cell wall biosynthesis